jgi:hypothetical protein
MVQIRDPPHSRDLEPAEFFISQSENCPSTEDFQIPKTSGKTYLPN